MNLLSRTAFGVMAAASLMAFNAQAQEHGSRDEAKAMAENAAKFVAEKGLDAAKKAFTKPAQKEFSDRDLYVFMYDPQGVVLAHGSKPDMIGTNRKDTPDADGKLYVQQMIKTAVGQPKWISYKFLNPVTKQVEDKVSYIIHVEKPDVLVGVGAYAK